MMEHIRQFDWCSSQLDNHFVFEEDLDNCVTEKILRNKFHDPLASSESEDEVNVIDWDEVFTRKKQNAKQQNFYIPVHHPLPPYPRLSAISAHHHYQCIKVLSHQNPNILPGKFIPRPTKGDLRVFEEIQDLYKKEQKEYIEWVKTLWTNSHCARALRPKPGIEVVYEAEFKMKAHEMKSFPKTYAMAAQIPLSMRNSGKFEMLHQEDLIKVNTEDLLNIEYPMEITKSFNILKPMASPTPCAKHLCRFILPGENSVTILPLTEMHRELAQYAAENGAQFIVSESALRSIVDTNRTWNLPISVCETIGLDGDKMNVIVIGSECKIEKEHAQMRTYRAYRHLLEDAVIPIEEKAKMLDKIKETAQNSPEKGNSMGNDKMESTDNVMVNVYSVIEDLDASSDEEEKELYIVTDDSDINMKSNDQNNEMSVENNETNEQTDENDDNSLNNITESGNIGVYNCTCKDTIFERPSPRSFRKYKVTNSVDKEHYDVIVHSSHKARNGNDEVIFEPTIEYLLDVGASEMQDSRVDSLSLSLMLRKNASLLHARVEGSTGEVATFELINQEIWTKRYPKSVERGIERVVSALSHLGTLLPAQYLFHHQPCHGDNAMLFVSRPGSNPEGISLNLESSQTHIDEAKGISSPPIISTAMLPYHKHRSILPCAFTPYEQQVAKEPKKPVTKQKAPPQAIKLGENEENGAQRPKWPKKKHKKKQKKN